MPSLDWDTGTFLGDPREKVCCMVLHMKLRKKIHTGTGVAFKQFMDLGLKSVF